MHAAARSRNFTACSFCRRPMGLYGMARVCQQCQDEQEQSIQLDVVTFEPLDYPPSDVRHYLSRDAEPDLGLMEFDPLDYGDYEEDAFERAVGECSLSSSGTCGAAGSEYCEFECPFTR